MLGTQSTSALETVKSAAFIPNDAVVHLASRRGKSKASKPPADPNAQPAEEITVDLRVARVACAGGLYGDMRVDESGEVWRWGQTVWENVVEAKGHQEVMRWLEANARGSYKAKTAKECWSAVRMRLATSSHFKPRPNQDRIIVPTRRAYLVVRDDGTIIAESPDKELGLHHRIDIDSVAPGQTYNPSPVPAESLFGQYLAWCMPDLQIRALVQEQCALTFTSGAQRSVLWMFGTGENGKGTLQTLMQGLHANPQALNLHKLNDAGHRVKCVGASLLTCSEAGGKKPWDEEAFKMIVAGDAMDVKYLYQDPFTYRNTAKMLIDAQNAPYFEDKSNGVASRLVPVLFSQTIPKHLQDNKAAEKMIAQELHLITDWILAGLQRIALRGGKPMPPEQWPEQVRAIMANTRTNNDPLRNWFIEKGVICDPTLPPRPKKDIENDWLAWCRTDGYVDAFDKPKLQGRAFWGALRKMPDCVHLITGRQDEMVADPQLPGTRTRACRMALGTADAVRMRDEAKRTEAFLAEAMATPADAIPF